MIFSILGAYIVILILMYSYAEKVQADNNKKQKKEDRLRWDRTYMKLFFIDNPPGTLAVWKIKDV